MNHNEVALLEERWIETQHARPTPQVRTLPLHDLILAPEVFQGRMTEVSGHLQEDHTRDLVRGIKSARTHLEPMTVFWIDGCYYIIDGHHRHAAYSRCEHDLPELMVAIPVNEFTGTFHEAVILSATANTKNKLPMSVIEKRQKAWDLLNLGKDFYGTQANITAITGVSKNTVGKYKKLHDECLEEGSDPKSYSLQEVICSAREDAEYNEEWEDMQAQAKANILRRVMGPVGRSHPEVMAKVMMMYLGEALAEQVVNNMAYDLGMAIMTDEGAEF